MEEKQAASHPPGCFFCTIAAPQIEALMDHIWPDDTREHFRNARIEVLKGMRSLLDARIEKLSRCESRGTKIMVD